MSVAATQPIATDQLRWDMRLFPNRMDRLAMAVVIVLAVAAPPFLGDYWLKAILIPMLIFSMAALGLNIVTGFAGLISLGQAAFMAVGAFSGVIAYGRYGIPIPITLLIAGMSAALVGAIVGTPSLRIKGLYLLVATLAAQFIILWAIQRIPWIGAGSMVTINTPLVEIAGFEINTSLRQYYFVLVVMALLTIFALNLTRSRVGRAWMAIREQDIAASVMGVSMLRYKLSAFMVSAFFGGIAGAMVVFAWVGAANAQEYELELSIQILGMIIIGGLGSVLGSFLGAAFVALLPIVISISMHKIYALTGGEIVSAAILANTEHLLFGSLVVFFLIVEPLGLAHLWHRFSRHLDSRLKAAGTPEKGTLRPETAGDTGGKRN